MKTLRLGIDIDGVLRDQIAALKRVYLKHYPKHRSKMRPVTEWDVDGFFPIGKDIYKLWFGPWAKDAFLEARPYPGAVEFVNGLFKAGHEVIIITSQPKGIEGFTVEWLHRHKINYSEIHFTDKKHLVDCDFLLDDKLETLLTGRTKGNARPVCMRRPWNKGWTGLGIDKYDEFYGIVNSHLNY